MEFQCLRQVLIFLLVQDDGFQKWLLLSNILSRFSQVETIFWPKRLEYDHLWSTLSDFLLVFLFDFFLFFLCQYHDSMTAIFILSLEFAFQFFADRVLLVINMMLFYWWFNRCNSDERHFKVLCWNSNVCYKKFLCCSVLVCMCASSKWHQLRENH